MVHVPFGLNFAAPYRSVDLGRLTDTSDVDALVLDADDLYVVSSLGRFGAANLIVPDATAAAIISTASLGNPGLPDLVVASTGASFERVVFHPGVNQGTFLSYPTLPFVAGLHDATLMAVADLDGQGLSDLLTVSASDPQRVYGWTFDAFGNVSFHLSFAVDEDITDLAAMRWEETDPADSVVVLTDSSMTVHDQLGNEHFQLAETLQAPGKVAVLSGESSTGADALAYMRRLDSVEWELALVDNGGLIFGGGGDAGTVILPFVGQALAPIQVAGLRAGDHDGDGDLDLLVSTTDYHAAFVYRNEPDAYGPVFDVAAGADRHFLYQDPFDQSIPISPTNAAFGDLDGDGQADVVALHPESGGLVQFWSTQSSPPGSGGTGAPQLSGSKQIYGVVSREEIDTSTGNQFAGPLRVYFEIPESIDINAYTHMHVQVWDRPAGGTLNPDALSNSLHPIGQPCLAENYSRRSFGVEIDLSPSFNFTWTAGRLVFVTYRLVHATESAGDWTIHSATRWLNYGVDLDADLSDPGADYGAEFSVDPEVRFQRLVRGLTDLTTAVCPHGANLVPGNQQAGIVLGVGVDVGRVSHLAGTPRPGPLTLSSDVFFYDPTTTGF